MRFLEAADCGLTEYIFRWTDDGRDDCYVARDLIWFALGADIRRGDATALRLPPGRRATSSDRTETCAP